MNNHPERLPIATICFLNRCDMIHCFLVKLEKRLEVALQCIEEETTMISTKKLAQMAKKWEKMANLGRKRLTLMAAEEDDECYTSMAPEGHCVMYSADGRQFKVPLAYLGTTVFAELLRMSQEEFGFGSDGRITLLCDAAKMEYVMCLLRRNASEEVGRAFLSFVASPCHQGNALDPPIELRQQVVVSSF